jgi:hypothetical protein
MAVTAGLVAQLADVDLEDADAGRPQRQEPGGRQGVVELADQRQELEPARDQLRRL